MIKSRRFLTSLKAWNSDFLYTLRAAKTLTPPNPLVDRRQEAKRHKPERARRVSVPIQSTCVVPLAELSPRILSNGCAGSTPLN